jgi:polyisoprenoid-binding protein YceI
VVLDVEGLTRESKDPWGSIRRGATATTTINRRDFGLTWNKLLETGGFAVGDEVVVILEIEMVKK